MVEFRQRLRRAVPGRFVVALVLPGAVVILSGCDSGSNPLCTVSGSVSFRGRPLDEANIVFCDVVSPQKAWKVKITNGEYEVPADQELRAGDYVVSVIALRKTGRTYIDPANPSVQYDEQRQYIPTKYNSSTELSIKLQPGENTYDLVLN